jgi:site-specific recombinase XerD
MKKAMLRINWDKSQLKNDINPVLKKYENYLRAKGFKESSIIRYRDSVKRYLDKTNSIKPTIEKSMEFRDELLKSNLKSSTINLYFVAIKQFYRMNGEDVEFPYLPVNNKLPYYLSSDDVLKILSVIPNLKHYSMIFLSFFCMLRASELTNLNDNDVDLKNLILRVREGKGKGKCGKDALLPINPDCAEVLRQYLKVRQKVVLEDGTVPFFPTDFSNRWERRDLYRMFVAYKKKAEINIPGGTHLLRHSAATILLNNGADLLTVKELLRHVSLSTTEKYIHLSKENIRNKYEKFLTLGDNL